MKKLIVIVICVMFLAPVAVVAKDKPNVKDTTQLEMQRLEFRALIAEIKVLQQQIEEKTQRARQLQGLIQAAETKEKGK